MYLQIYFGQGSYLWRKSLNISDESRKYIIRATKSDNQRPQPTFTIHRTSWAIAPRLQDGEHNTANAEAESSKSLPSELAITLAV
jgi:hypothetical protein